MNFQLREFRFVLYRQSLLNYCISFAIVTNYALVCCIFKEMRIFPCIFSIVLLSLQLDKLSLEVKKSHDAASSAEVARESSEKQYRELQRQMDELERVGVRILKNEIRTLERKVSL